MKQPSGNFGMNVAAYEALRPKYPSKAIHEVVKHIRKSSALILDLGCGTGISTRQLASKVTGLLVGCDTDQEMLSSALNSPGKNIAYVVAAMPKLPFDSGLFDAVTAFTSFHWFCDQPSIKEVKRVLKKSGILCIVQPRHTSPFAGDLRMVIERELGHAVPPKYKKADFETSLKKGGFAISQRSLFKDAHSYSLSEYLTLIQSYSVWNDVPKERQEEILKALEAQFSTRLQKGLLRDTRDVEVIIASSK